jgi:hypothetical protein
MVPTHRQQDQISEMGIEPLVERGLGYPRRFNVSSRTGSANRSFGVLDFRLSATIVSSPARAAPPCGHFA